MLNFEIVSQTKNLTVNMNVSIFIPELSPVDENKEKEHNSSSKKHIQKSLSATALTLLINPNGKFDIYTYTFVRRCGMSSNETTLSSK